MRHTQFCLLFLRCNRIPRATVRFLLYGFFAHLQLLQAAPAQPLILSDAQRQWLAAHPRIRVAPEQNYPPFIYVDGAGAVRGISADYLELVARRLGVNIEFLPARPLAEQLEAARTGQVDVLTSLRSTAQRRLYLDFTQPYVETPAVVVGRIGTPSKSIESLAQTGDGHVAVGRGYGVQSYLEARFPDLALLLVADDESALRAVRTGEASAAVVDIASASWVINHQGFSDLQIMGDSGFQYALSFAVRKDWPELRVLLDSALNSLSHEERALVYRDWIGDASGLAIHPWSWKRRVALMLGVLALVTLGVIRHQRRRLRERARQAGTEEP